MKRILTILALFVTGLTVIVLVWYFLTSKSEPGSILLLEPLTTGYEEKTIMKGINLGNAFDAPTPGEWGVIIKPEHLTAIKEAGYNTVRFPVRVSAHTQPSAPYRVDPGLLSQMDDVINAGLQNGLIVILDLHHYLELMEDPDGQEERFLAIWRQLGEHYASYPESLYFEALNEPTGRLDTARWNDLLAKGISTIRETNPDRKVLVGTSQMNSAVDLDQLVLPDDPNLVATFHYYEPLPFTHQGADWVNGSQVWVGIPWKGTRTEKRAITTVMNSAAAWSKRHKVPMVLGEFGAIYLADRESRARWMSFVAREAEKRNIGWIHWQFCSDFPVYDCQQDQWDVDMLRALIPEGEH